MNIRAIIVEDEIHNQKNLQAIIENFCPDVELLEIADSVDKAVSAIQRLRPDLVFLDIKIKLGTGFQVLEKIPDYDISVIFITAHDRFAKKAFKYPTIDYLLKPIDVNELVKVVEKVKKKKREQIRARRELALLQNMRSDIKKITVSCADTNYFIPIRSIIMCEASNNYTTFFLSNGDKITSAKTLKLYEQKLEGNAFFRVSKSHLVNTEYIRSYKRSGFPHVILENKTVVKVSQTKKEDLLKFMAEVF